MAVEVYIKLWEKVPREPGASVHINAPYIVKAYFFFRTVEEFLVCSIPLSCADPFSDGGSQAVYEISTKELQWSLTGTTIRKIATTT